MMSKKTTRRNDSIPESSSSQRSLTVHEKPKGFLERVIQFGIDSCAVDFAWIERLEQELMTVAESIADRQSQHTSPSDVEILGAQQRASQYLSWALENRSRGGVSAALNDLLAIPLGTLIEQGEEDLEAFRGMIRRFALKFMQQSGRLGATFDFAGANLASWSEQTLEGAGREHRSPEDAVQLVTVFFEARHRIVIGDSLEKCYPTFFADAPNATYDQLLGNLAVAGLFGRPEEPRVTVQNVRRFALLAFVGGSMPPGVNDALLSLIESVFERSHCPEAERLWFRSSWWPELTATWNMFFSKAFTAEDCMSYGVFQPFGRRKGEDYRTAFGLSRDAFQAFADRFVELDPKAQLEMLGAFDGLTAFSLLQHLEVHKPDGCAALLIAQLPVAIAADILYNEEAVGDADFDAPNPNMPPWALSYLRSLTGARKGAVRRAFRALTSQGEKRSR